MKRDDNVGLLPVPLVKSNWDNVGPQLPRRLEDLVNLGCGEGKVGSDDSEESEFKKKSKYYYYYYYYLLKRINTSLNT